MIGGPSSDSTPRRSLRGLSPHDQLPPDSRQLQATVTCDGCAATFSRYTWPVTATLGAGDNSITVPVAEMRGACPECGRPMVTDVDSID